MDRRHFLAAGGLAAVAPALGQITASGKTEMAGGQAASPLFRSVNFHSDGVDYTPAEYATHLREVTTREGLSADYYSLGGAVESLEKKPYAWPQMALVADHVDGYAEEYARAWRDTEAMMALLAKDGRFGFSRVPNGTSRYYMTVQGADLVGMVERARRHDVFLSRPHPVTGTLGMQVNTSVLRSTPEALARVLMDAASG